MCVTALGTETNFQLGAEQLMLTGFELCISRDIALVPWREWFECSTQRPYKRGVCVCVFMGMHVHSSVSVEEVEDYVGTIMDQEFDTMLEDGSLTQVRITTHSCPFYLTAVSVPNKLQTLCVLLCLPNSCL